MNKKNLGILDKNNTILLIIDPQEKLMPHMKDKELTTNNIIKLIKSFKIMNIPIILTEQYPKGLGNTVKEIKDELNQKAIEKITFSCCDINNFKNKLKKDVAIAGIESHVCVTQTLLDLLNQGFRVHLVCDAISSRKESDKKIAIKRAAQAGAFLTTTEMIIFQLLKRAGTEEFKKVQEIIK